MNKRMNSDLRSLSQSFIEESIAAPRPRPTAVRDLRVGDHFGDNSNDFLGEVVSVTPTETGIVVWYLPAYLVGLNEDERDDLLERTGPFTYPASPDALVYVP